MARSMLDTITDRLLGSSSRKFGQKASAAAPAIVGTSVGTPVWTPRDFSHFSEEGYIKNAVAFFCISSIARCSAFTPLCLFDAKTNTEIDDINNPLLKLIEKPAPGMTGSELIERAVTYLLIAGNSYFEKVGASRVGATAQELYVHRPDRMKVIAGSQALPQAYEYEANGRRIRWDVDQLKGLSPIMHLKTINPTNDWYGLSAMDPAAYAIDRHNMAGAHNMALLQNGAVPSGALLFKPVVVDGAQQYAPSEVIEAAEKRLVERYSGSENAGKPMTLGGNIEWQQFGFSMEQLQLVDSKSDAARDICTVYNFPHVLVVPGQSTYNNNREAKLALYEENIIPRMEWIVKSINNWLVPEFGDNLRFKIDYDSIDALSPRRDEKRTTYVELFKSRIVTRNEVRDALSFDDNTDLPEQDSIPHEVTAVTQLIINGKLSSQTGFQVLTKLGLPLEGIDAATEQELIAQENGGVDGNTGIDPVTGQPLDPLTGKPVPADPQGNQPPMGGS